MMAFPAQEPNYAGNAFLAVARKALFRPTISLTVGSYAKRGDDKINTLKNEYSLCFRHANLYAVIDYAYRINR